MLLNETISESIWEESVIIRVLLAQYCSKWHVDLFEKVSFEILWDGDKIFRLGNNNNNDFFVTFWTKNVPKMDQNVRGSRNRCICRRAVAIVSK